MHFQPTDRRQGEGNSIVHRRWRGGGWSRDALACCDDGHLDTATQTLAKPELLLRLALLSDHKFHLTVLWPNDWSSVGSHLLVFGVYLTEKRHVNPATLLRGGATPAGRVFESALNTDTNSTSHVCEHLSWRRQERGRSSPDADSAPNDSRRSRSRYLY
ncbi:hypothetical protein E2C01_042805 [Portunus trituberculatus]|uniref:Uncharacterized protein n=1 Tax=Portunus trituberculatus TaxID=210409 RepID=A0A5B7FUD9_PORTR|nr:hypothetical protein [Portunus trituberculatus]